MFSKFRKNKCRKVLQFSVSQEFANRFLVLQVSQGFCNGQFADGQFLLQTLAMNLQQAAPPLHKDTSCWRVVSYHRLHSCLAVKECSLHSLSAQHRRPQSQKTHIPAPAKTARTQCLLQPCKSQPKMALEHYKEFMAQGTCRAAGTINGFTQRWQGALWVV